MYNSGQFNQPPQQYNQQPNAYNQAPPIYPNQPPPNQYQQPPPNNLYPQPNYHNQPGYPAPIQPGQPNLNDNIPYVQPHPYQPVEDGENKSEGLGGSARNNFIKKVYSLVALQLLVTALIGYWAFNSEWFKKTFVNTVSIIIISVLMLALSFVIGCCTGFFRKYALPIFILFTLVMSLLVGIAICGYKSKVVLLSVAITLVVVIALTIYAWVTDTDFTTCGPYLMIFGIILLFFGIACIFWRDPIVHLIYACLGALLFSIYLIFDTQLILGKGQFSFSLDDAYLAALMLYIDIIQLFLAILRIVGFASN